MDENEVWGWRVEKSTEKIPRAPTTEALNALKTVFKNSWPTLLTRINAIAMENGLDTNTLSQTQILAA